MPKKEKCKGPEDLKPGDVVRITWMDAYGLIKITHEEVLEQNDPLSTTSWGIVVKHTENCIIIAQELSEDDEADGNCVKIIPYGCITLVEVLDHEFLPNLGID